MDLRENFTGDVSLDKDAPVTFWNSSGSGVDCDPERMCLAV